MQDGAADHQEQLILEMRIPVPEDEKKFVRQEDRPGQDDEAETDHAAGDAGVEPAQLARLLAARESGGKDVGDEVAEDRENHRETPERADFGDRPGAAAKEGDEKNGDLPLETEEDRVRSLVANEADHRLAIGGVFLRLQIDHGAGVAPEEKILQEKSARTDEGGHAGIEKNKGEREQDRQARDRAGEIDLLNLPDIGAQTRNDIEHAERELHIESAEHGDDQESRVEDGRSIFHQHVVKQRRHAEDGGRPKFAAQL